jgi:hypothetical protein
LRDSIGEDSSVSISYGQPPQSRINPVRPLDEQSWCQSRSERKSKMIMKGLKNFELSSQKIFGKLPTLW